MSLEVRTISLLVATRNRKESLGRLLASIGRIEIPRQVRVQVAVIDNGSCDGTADFLARWNNLPANGIFFSLSESRPGKASALNHGLVAVPADYFLIIDDDVVVDPGVVARHLEGYGATSFDALQGRILPGVDPVGRRADPRRLREYNIPLVDYGSDYRELRGLTGTNMSFKREVVEKVGVFNPRLGPGASGFSEDSEFSIRVRRAGFKIGYTPHAIVYHELSPTRYGRRYNRAAEFRKGVSRSIYRRDSIVFRVLPDLLANCLRYGVYRVTGAREKAYKTEGRIMKGCGYLAGKLRPSGGETSDLDG
jgi:GT2 family glycosyltransferase